MGGYKALGGVYFMVIFSKTCTIFPNCELMLIEFVAEGEGFTWGVI